VFWEKKGRLKSLSPTDVYGGLDTAELVKLMGAAFALAELKGMAAVQAEAAAGAG